MQKTLTLIPNLLLQLWLVLAVVPPMAASQKPIIAKPACIHHCGNIPIPFPFGTSRDCYHSDAFWVTCNDTVQNPPKLFWQDSTIEITKISLDGQMTIRKAISYHCISRDGSKEIGNHQLTSIRLFTVNNTANKLTVIGCDSNGYVSGIDIAGRNYSTGCMASCISWEDLEEGLCMGIGCCQAQIPKNAWLMEIEVDSDDKYDYVWQFSNCTYGFVVEETTFKFYPKNLTNLKRTEKLPMVLDWAIDNRTCDEAEKSNPGYACKSVNSLCFMPENGEGYRCRCADGYVGNPYLTDGCHDIDECNGPNSKELCAYLCVNKPGGFDCLCPKGYRGVGKTIIHEGDCRPNESHTPKLVAGVAIAAILFLLIVCLAYLEYSRRQSRRAKHMCFLQNGGDLLLQRLHTQSGSRDSLKIFSSMEIKKATNDFHKDNIVGHGGFGTVYRGLLTNNQIVAIKKSKRVDVDQVEQFVNEVIILSQINHRNTVKLLGCCLETEVPHLVYEFIGNGTLYMHLHDPRRACLLNWENRLRISAETAGVLAYLHSSASIPIIHRDVKSDNILLDDTFTAKVSDFGASKLIPLDQTRISTVVQGTTGYLDPEYFLTHHLTAKSDVYSFGVVLLEIITGRSAINFSRPEEERSLVKLSLALMEQDNFYLLVDPSMATDQDMEQIMEVARIAKWCLQMKGEERPTMTVVAMELENLRLGSRVVKINEPLNSSVELDSTMLELDSIKETNQPSLSSCIGSLRKMSRLRSVHEARKQLSKLASFKLDTLTKNSIEFDKFE